MAKKKDVTLREHLQRIGAIGGKAKAKPTECPRCGVTLPTAREAWVHCRAPRAKKAAAKKAAAKTGRKTVPSSPTPKPR